MYLICVLLYRVLGPSARSSLAKSRLHACLRLCVCACFAGVFGSFRSRKPIRVHLRAASAVPGCRVSALCMIHIVHDWQVDHWPIANQRSP
jgi:hypothetical protein